MQEVFCLNLQVNSAQIIERLAQNSLSFLVMSKSVENHSYLLSAACID